jgi:hypothetical protein
MSISSSVSVTTVSILKELFKRISYIKDTVNRIKLYLISFPILGLLLLRYTNVNSSLKITLRIIIRI